MKKIIIGLIIWLSIVLVFVFNQKDEDVLEYNHKDYVYLDIENSVFTYFYNNNNGYIEEDKIIEVDHDLYDLIYDEGDLYILKSQLKQAKDYYDNDDNYKWRAQFEIEDATLSNPITLTKDDIDYLYDLDHINKEETMVFDDIQEFGDIIKVSDDDLIVGVINLVKVNDQWYYKTEIMSDDDKEYIISLPESINQQMHHSLKEAKYAY